MAHTEVPCEPTSKRTITLDELNEQLVSFLDSPTSEKGQQIRDITDSFYAIQRGLPKCLLPPDGFTSPGEDPVISTKFNTLTRKKYQKQDLAIRQLRMIKFASGEARERLKQAFERQVVIEKTLSHPHIASPSLAAHSETDSTPYLVLPWMTNAVEYLHSSRDKLPGLQFSSTVNYLLRQIASGLAYIHSEGVNHGNVRASNILIAPDGAVKLTDVGMWRVYETLSSSYAGLEQDNHLWNAPEILLPEDDHVGRVESSSDVYAFASTCVELYTLNVPYAPAELSFKLQTAIMAGKRPDRPNDPNGILMQDDLWGLVNECWVQEPKDRPCMDYILEELTSIAKAGGAQQLIQPDSIQLRKLGRLWTSFRHALGAQ